MSGEPSVTLLDFNHLRERDALEPGFARELVAVAQGLGLDPNGLAAVMALESQFNPQAVNPSSGATGLTQIMPATAAGLGTSIPSLRRMTALEQLEFVRRFYAKVAKNIRPQVTGDYYMANFMPAFIGAPDTAVLSTQGHPIYDQNAGLDVDGDGTLTVGDVTRKIESIVDAATAKPRAVFTSVKKKPAPPPSSPSDPCSSSPSSSSAPSTRRDGAK